MASIGTFDSWRPTWRGLRQRFDRRAAAPSCRHVRGVWRRFRGARGRVLLHGSYYCLDQCLEGAVMDALGKNLPPPSRNAAARRVPIGLLLLDRQQVTGDQLRAALAAQRTAGRGRLGEWLQSMGFANEGQVTAALARQWSCPVLRSDAAISALDRLPQIPQTLLESVLMLPVAWVEATRTLHLAFSEGIEYGVLYAIEQMLDCRTEPCFATPSLVRRRLETVSARRREDEARIDRVSDCAELARIVRSYCLRLSPHEIRMAWCGVDFWVRLFRQSSGPVDLLLRVPAETLLSNRLLSRATPAF